MRATARLVGALLASCLAVLVLEQPALAMSSSAAEKAARVALDRGDRTAVAVLDLRSGAYSAAGDDTGTFPSESVAKVFIAVRLLLTGQMSGATEATAYRMITTSDDAAANALYVRAGGDAVVDLVGTHYGIADLGAPPPVPGRWGLTRITARGLVQLYAALAKDPAVQPWLGNAMQHAARIAADGTDQSFGLPSATRGTAVKQGWGHDGVGRGHAVINSTGYVGGGRLAVAILTAGPAESYGRALQGVVTAQARALTSGLGRQLAAAAPAGRTGGADTVPAARERGHGLPATVVLGLVALAGVLTGSVQAARRLRGRLRAHRDERSPRRGEGAGRGPAQSALLVGRLVRLPSGQVLRITAASAPTPARTPWSCIPGAAAARPAAPRWAPVAAA